MSLLAEPFPTSPWRDFALRLYRAVRRSMNFVSVLGLLFLALDPAIADADSFAFAKQVSVLPIYTVFLLHLLLALYLSGTFAVFLLNYAIDLAFFIPLFFFTFGGVHPSHILLLRQFIYYFHRYLRESTLSHLATAISDRPARLFSMSFLGVILTGAFFLVLPVSVAPGAQPSFLTALFTSTSAVCVTGLNVIDPGTYFSLFGQLVVLALIQVGGLGIMTLSAVVSMLVGKRMAFAQRTVMQNVLDQSDLNGLLTNLKQIVGWTLAIEGLGTLILGLRFYQRLSCDVGRALYLGLFHSVSAFCNAGFALFPDSLVGFAEDIVVSGTIMLLIVTGGLGFTVLTGMIQFLTVRRRRFSHDVHTVLVVVTTVVLILAGAIQFLSLETRHASLEKLSGQGKVMAAFFQSVTTRTAGFNTVDIGTLRDGTLFFMILLMFIGASPGSTGGGIKTTTLATMVLALDAQVQNREEVVVMERTIPKETVVKAFLITAIFAALVAGFTFILLLLEPQPLIKLLFEVVSAFATVGLSVGVTPSLGDVSRLVIICAMFIGRIGPLTLALTVSSAAERGHVSYPSTKVLVG